MRCASCCPGRSFRPCCRVRVVRRPELRDACPSPPESVICRRKVTAPAPVRIRLPDRHCRRWIGSRRRCIGCRRSVGEATGTAGGHGVHQVDPAVAVEHDRFTGMGIDRRDEHSPLRPELTGQPSGDGSAPPRLRRTVRRRIHFERPRTHSAAHVGRILSGGDDCARCLHVVRRGPGRHGPTVGSGRCSPWLGRGAKDVGKQFGRGRAGYLGRGGRSGRRPDDQIGLGHIQPGLKQAGDDADQPRIACRSATTKDQRCTGGVFRDVVRGRLRVVLK